MLNKELLTFNHNYMGKQTLEDAFRELIQQRKWYVNSLRSPVQAKNDKANFLQGKKIPEERIRNYLSAAGWICAQQELWQKSRNNIF